MQASSFCLVCDSCVEMSSSFVSLGCFYIPEQWQHVCVSSLKLVDCLRFN